MNKSFLSEADAVLIKAHLWDGEYTQTAIAEKFEVTQPTVSRILNGEEWDAASWPDGTTGSIPSDRYRQAISRKRRKSAFISHGRSEEDAEELTLAVEKNKIEQETKREDNLKSVAKGK